MKLKSIITVSLSMCCMVLAAVTEDKLVTIWSKNDVRSFNSSDIEKMVIEEVEPAAFAINDMGRPITLIRSWGEPHAVADFAVEPIELLDEYSVEEGSITATLDGLEPCAADIYDGEMVTVNRKQGIVTVHFTSLPKEARTGKVKLTIGEGSTAIIASVDVIMYPSIQFASFYGETAGPDIASMPYLDGRPSLGTLTMFIASKCEKVIDVNSEDEVRVAMNVEGGTTENIKEAVKCYKWKITQGVGTLQTVRDDYEIVESHGFDAVLGVRSGLQTGTVVYECETPVITSEESTSAELENREPNPLTLTLTYRVVNINKDYPIKKIEVNNDNVEMNMNDTYIVNLTVTPMASYAFQKVKVDVADPSIVEVGCFEGLDLPIKGLNPGTTTITFSAYNNTELMTKTMTVTVKDPLGRIEIDSKEGASYIFAGSTTTWKANGYTLSGVLMSNVDMTWGSSNTGVATADNGVITGVAAGSAGITAKSGDVTSGIRSIRVVAAPGAINSADGFQGFYEDGNDIVFLDANDGYLVIKGGYADGKFTGSYTLNGAYYMASDAYAPATGSVTINKANGEDQYEYIVTMYVSVNLSAERKVPFVFNGRLWYLPE